VIDGIEVDENVADVVVAPGVAESALSSLPSSMEHSEPPEIVDVTVPPSV
jgi:hypothetical protein